MRSPHWRDAADNTETKPAAHTGSSVVLQQNMDSDEVNRRWTVFQESCLCACTEGEGGSNTK